MFGSFESVVGGLVFIAFIIEQVVMCEVFIDFGCDEVGGCVGVFANDGAVLFEVIEELFEFIFFSSPFGGE